jgi:phage terminase large subunit
MSNLKLEIPEWGLDFLEPSRYKGLHGGRGSSKSHFFAEMVVEAHLLNPESRTVCIREVQKSLSQSVKALIELKIEAMGVGSYFEVQQSIIKNVHGEGLIIFQGMANHTAESIKSLEGFDRAFVEEAQSLSQRSLDLLRPTIRKEGSELWFAWNPSQATDPIDVLLRGEQRPENAIVKQINYDDNPWFPDVLKEEMEYDKKRDFDKYLHVWRGEYQANSEARVFKNWEVKEFEAPRDAMFRLGADWGFATDPTTLIRCYLEGRTLYFDYECYAIGCDIIDTPDLFMQVPESEKWPIIADSARPETISHLRKNGFPKIMGAIKGAKSVEEGIEFLKSYDIIVHPRCTHIIDELTHYKYKIDPLTDKVLPLLEDKHNHCIAEGEIVLTKTGNKSIENITCDDFVLTRGGYQRVLFAGVTDEDRETMILETTLGEVRCTPDHKIFTSRGFLTCDSLRYNDEILNLEERTWLSTINGMALNIIATPIQRIQQQGAILGAQLQKALNHCTAKFGAITTALFPKVCTFTTGTGTHSITAYQTLSVLPQRNTHSDTNGAKSAERGKENTSPKYDTLQKPGTPHRKELKSTEKSGQWLTTILNPLTRIVSNAKKSLKQNSSVTRINFALTNASQRLGESQALIIFSRIAHNVKSLLQRINTRKPKLVQGRVLTVRRGAISRRVYDLTVENHHEFIAGGVLVSNCIDAARYALEGVRRAAKPKPKHTAPIPTVTSWG